MLKRIKNLIKKVPGVKIFLLGRKLLFPKIGLFKKIILISNFFTDFQSYKKINKNKNFSVLKNNLKLCLFDKTADTLVDYVYFYQNAWCAKKIFQAKPREHHDIGTQAGLISIISQFIPTIMVDIRPLDVRLSGLNFIQGDITALPFKDSSLDSISSICVIEHIGLGRYGDKLDSFGSEKSAAELKRILSPNGSLYISLPVDKENTIYFNAHRAFTREYVLKLFEPLKLMEEKYIYKNELGDNYDKTKGFGTGLFHFKKII